MKDDIASVKNRVEKTHEHLRVAVKGALEKKRKLGQYSVTWHNDQIVTQGEDAPKIAER